jgi:predicted Fe-Mo cluster-binding NifX family protein
MKIAITSEDGRQVSGHAGHCRGFWLCTVDGGGVRERVRVELEPGETFHAAQHRIPAALDGMNVLVAGGMGPGLRARLAAVGIAVIATDETDIDRVIAKVSAGAFGELQSREDACARCGDDRHAQ